MTFKFAVESYPDDRVFVVFNASRYVIYTCPQGCIHTHAYANFPISRNQVNSLRMNGISTMKSSSSHIYTV